MVIKIASIFSVQTQCPLWLKLYEYFVSLRKTLRTLRLNGKG